MNTGTARATAKSMVVTLRKRFEKADEVLTKAENAESQLGSLQARAERALGETQQIEAKAEEAKVSFEAEKKRLDSLLEARRRKLAETEKAVEVALKKLTEDSERKRAETEATCQDLTDTAKAEVKDAEGKLRAIEADIGRRQVVLDNLQTKIQDILAEAS